VREYGYPFSGLADCVESGIVNLIKRDTLEVWTYSSAAIWSARPVTLP